MSIYLDRRILDRCCGVSWNITDDCHVPNIVCWHIHAALAVHKQLSGKQLLQISLNKFDQINSMYKWPCRICGENRDSHQIKRSQSVQLCLHSEPMWSRTRQTNRCLKSLTATVLIKIFKTAQTVWYICPKWATSGRMDAKVQWNSPQSGAYQTT